MSGPFVGKGVRHTVVWEMVKKRVELLKVAYRMYRRGTNHAP